MIGMVHTGIESALAKDLAVYPAGSRLYERRSALYDGVTTGCGDLEAALSCYGAERDKGDNEATLLPRYAETSDGDLAQRL